MSWSERTSRLLSRPSSHVTPASQRRGTSLSPTLATQTFCFKRPRAIRTQMGTAATPKAKNKNSNAPAARGDTGGPAPQTPRDISGQKKQQDGTVIWLDQAERELKKIPFFVRGKARRNTESFASERGLSEISLDTLYEAKAHFAR